MNRTLSPRIQLRGISKSFPGVNALQQVDFDLLQGEVHILCGENGAGKSTLMHILAGNLQPDQGTIFLQEKETIISGPEQAILKGIAIVYQERSLMDNLSVAENIFANRQPRHKTGLIDFKKMFSLTNDLLDKLLLNDIHPATKAGRLSAAQKQMVEIAKALSNNPSVLILDEPTASITERETQLLFDIIRDLQAQGISIIYISHRMREIFEIGDRITILKDGKYQGTFPVKEITQEMLIRKMIGRDIPPHPISIAPRQEVALEVKQFSGKGFHDISFQLHKGEILALAGLVGAGRTEIARALFGADPVHHGCIFINGQNAAVRHPHDAIMQGIGYLPEERKEKGLFLQMSMEENILSGKMAIQKGGMDHHTNRDTIDSLIRRLRITPANPRQKVVNLSGGTQQKVVLAKWLLLGPEIFIADEPTHGIDVGAKFEIYQLLQQLAADGASILLISSELPEVLKLAHRILVIHNGHITASIPRNEATEENIMHYASGIKNMYSNV